MNIVSLALGICLILPLLTDYCLIIVNEKSGRRNEELFEENENLKEDIDRAYTLLTNYCLINVNEKSGRRNEELFEENENLKEDIDRAYTFARQAAKDYAAIADKVGVLFDREWERVPPTNFEVLNLLDEKIAAKRTEAADD